MLPRNLGALFCGMAAVALLVAAFMPWFATPDHGDDDESRYTRRYAVDLHEQDLADPRGWRDMRGNFGLAGGEVCVRLQCKSVSYTGARGKSDDVFAWLGRATLGAALAGVALLIAAALAGRTQRRPILRGWAAAVVAGAAGLGAAFASSQTLDGIAPYLERGMGLGAVVLGAGLAGIGIALPWGPEGEPRAARRYGLAGVLVVLVTAAWVTLLLHAWWRSGRSLDIVHVSPLGVEVCEGGDCQLSSAFGASTGQRGFGALTVLSVAALILPAFGAASRIVRGIAPGAWGWATAALAWVALAFGLATWAVYDDRGFMTVGWGLPLFAVATAGCGAAAVVSILLLRARDEAAALAPAPVSAPLPPGATAPGAKPVLAALGPAPTVTVPAPTAPVPAPVPASVPASVPAATATAPTLTVPVPAEPAVAAAPLPQARALVPRGPTAAAQLAKRTSPMCPSCRVATLWHGKRGAWWCSTCKQTV